MSPEIVFQIHLVLGYVPWLLRFGVYVWPWLNSMEPVEAQRAIATLHSFRFFGLVFIIPGIVGANLPSGFAAFAAYGEFTTGVLDFSASTRDFSLVWCLCHNSPQSISSPPCAMSLVGRGINGHSQDAPAMSPFGIRS